MSESEQSTLPGLDAREPTPQPTVYVVLANYMDDPHPHLEGVYWNEEAAERHRDAITRRDLPPHIAWTVEQSPVRREIGPCPFCGSTLFREEVERPRPLENLERCPECGTEI